MYSFLFDRRSLALLVGGAAAAGVLLFVAGVLVGLRINLPAPTAQTAEFKTLSAFEGGLIGTATAEPASGPAMEPLSAAEPEPAEPAPTPVEPTPRPAQPTAARAQAVPPPAPPVEAHAEPPSVATQPPPDRVEASPAPAAPTPVPVPVTPEPEPAPVAAAPAPPPAETRVEAPSPAQAVASTAEPAPTTGPRLGHYVQVGAYAVAENAQKQLQALRSEGFNGYIATHRASSGRTLNVVCFGSYPTLRAAFIDAQKYLAGEPGREAIVRSPE